MAGCDVIQTCRLHFTYAATERRCLPDGLWGYTVPGTVLRVGYNCAGTLVWSYSSLVVYFIYVRPNAICMCVSVEGSRKSKRSYNGFWVGWKGLNAFCTRATICHSWYLVHHLHLSGGRQISFCIYVSAYLPAVGKGWLGTFFMGDICLSFSLTRSKQGKVWSANNKKWNSSTSGVV